LKSDVFISFKLIGHESEGWFPMGWRLICWWVVDDCILGFLRQSAPSLIFLYS